MTNANPIPEPDEVPESGATPETGADAQASAPAADSGTDDAASGDEDLTVDDILSAPQTDEAASSDAEGGYLADLKRVQAEYANFRRRTEEQRVREIQRAKGEVVKGLLPVLDDLDRATQHGDLVEGSAFAVIAEKVRGVAERLGVVVFGEKGDEFDPQLHEAIHQVPTPGAVGITVLEVVEVGYRLGDVELRPAKVVVAVPAE